MYEQATISASVLPASARQNGHGDPVAVKEPAASLLPLQCSLTVGAPDDALEHEADKMADTVMRMPNVSNTSAVSDTFSPNSFIQRKCAACEEEEKAQRKPLSASITPFIQTKSNGEATTSASLSNKINNSRGSGTAMDDGTRSFMETRFGSDFSSVKIHTGNESVMMNRELNAKAFTVGNDIYFNEGQYNPQSDSGKHLLAHELTHTIQQGKTVQPKQIQRAVLTSPRLTGNTLFLDVINNRAVIERGDNGQEVRRIQQLLIDLGFSLPVHGADGDFGTETVNAVKAFQRSRIPALPDDGRVGFSTLAAFDAAFPAFALPANLNNPWTLPCVLSMLCPWNRHLVTSVLPTFNIVTFTSRTFPTETWNGASWVAGTFTSGGFRSGTNMGFLNSTTCRQMAFTIYHEGWHAQQPSGLTGVVDVEKDAYINAEQWSINMGIPGQGTFTNNATGLTQGFRRTVGGETVVDEPSAETFVRQEYGGVSSVPGERILRRVGAIQVEVMRPDTTTYTRNANVGESVRGAVSMPGLAPIPPASWVCP